MAYTNDDIRRLESLKHDIRNRLVLQYRNKTDEELKAIIAHNSNAIYGDDIVETYKILAESEACARIITVRAEEKALNASKQLAEQQAFKSAISEWRENLEARKMNAIVNLSAAVSYHGQLVAAILDEEALGLTAQEICQWSEELAVLNEDDLKQLLTALVKEGIIVFDKKSTRYHLLTICDESLFPPNATQWAHRKYSYQHQRSLDAEQSNFLAALEASSTPLTEYDWFEITGNAKELERAKTEKWFSQSAIIGLTGLVNRGVLMTTPVKDTKFSLYYFPMLGEGK